MNKEKGERMSDLSAAKVLMSHLHEITDGAYKTATEIAIEVLINEAKIYYYVSDEQEVALQEFLGLSDEEFDRWAVRKE